MYDCKENNFRYIAISLLLYWTLFNIVHLGFTNVIKNWLKPKSGPSYLSARHLLVASVNSVIILQYSNKSSTKSCQHYYPLVHNLSCTLNLLWSFSTALSISVALRQHVLKTWLLALFAWIELFSCHILKLSPQVSFVFHNLLFNFLQWTMNIWNISITILYLTPSWDSCFKPNTCQNIATSYWLAINFW